MSGLKRRLTRRRATEPEPAAGPPGESVAEPAEPSLLRDPAAEQPTERLPVTVVSAASAAPVQPPATTTAVEDLPAGIDPAELADAPDSSARRGRLRRRIEFLRSARELLLRDLGGFVYELHRTARDAEQQGHRRLRATKLERLDRVDAELHDLEQRLDDPRHRVVVREPGVGGECHRCGELFGSDANYCAHCGAPLTEAARKARLKAERPRGEPHTGAATEAGAAAPSEPEAAAAEHRASTTGGAAPGEPEAAAADEDAAGTGGAAPGEPEAATAGPAATTSGSATPSEPEAEEPQRAAPKQGSDARAPGGEPGPAADRNGAAPGAGPSADPDAVTRVEPAERSS